MISNRFLLIAALAALIAAGCSSVGTMNSTQTEAVPIQETLNSPNGVNEVVFTVVDGVPYYSVNHGEKAVFEPSRLGVTLADKPGMDSELSLLRSTFWNVDEEWTTAWGEFETIKDEYSAMKLDLGREGTDEPLLTYVFRAYDDGFAFRYVVHGVDGDSVQLMDEATEFNFAEDGAAWWIPGYAWNRYEYLFTKSPISELDKVHTPLTVEMPSGYYLSIHEAALTDFASMTLVRTDSLTLEADLVPWSDGVRVRGPLPLVSPWRTVVIAETPGGLVESRIELNCNEPSKLEDTSWIKPGKYVGIWWSLHLGLETWGSGDKHGATTENTKRYIDFAAKYGFDGVLVEGWNDNWDYDWVGDGRQFSFTKPYPDYDLEGLAAYAKKKGVQIIAHNETGAGILNYENQLDDAFSLYQKLGIHAIKSGYVSHEQGIIRRDPATGDSVGMEWHHGQYMVQHYRHVVEEAAKHQIMVDVHEPIKDTGIRRTWPNMMTREGARGQEYNAWASDGGNTPEYTVTIPFTRMLSGPMDFTPGVLDILLEQDERPTNRINMTIAKQLALYVLIYSPLHMAADLPENYEAHRDAFQFIIDVPTDWSETKVLNGVIGDYTTIARKDRNSEDWYLGSGTDEHARELTVPLDFLSDGLSYTAQLYLDGPEGDWVNNPMALEIREQTVTADDTLQLKLAAGGGAAIRFVANEATAGE